MLCRRQYTVIDNNIFRTQLYEKSVVIQVNNRFVRICTNEKKALLSPEFATKR